MKKKILIIDDDEVLVDVLKLIFEDEGYVVISTTITSIPKTLLEHQPNLILLDYKLPGISGDKIASYCKSQKHTSNIPIIMFSASSNARQIAVEVGADDFIEKPFNMKVLLKKIARWLRRH